MSQIVVVDPDRLQQFGAPQGAVFCLVTNPDIMDLVEVVESGSYAGYLKVPMREGEVFEDVLRHRVPEPAHVLAISPRAFFASPRNEDLGPRRKLMAMACNSTPTTLDVVRHFIGCMERTSAAEQGTFSDTFFDHLEAAEHLEYVDAKRDTKAVLQHLDDGLEWNQQAGPLDWGEQQIVPSGEISVLPVEITEFHEDMRLPLEGRIVLRGHPILHNGTPSYTRTDQARIHARLAAMKDHAIIATVENGAITELHADTPGAQPGIDMLNAMFEVDSRYRIVWEIGHALNTSLDLLPGNHAMNEVYGGTHGCLHWGLGLTPYTQFHLDIIAPDTTVYTDTGDRVLGVDGGYPSDRPAAPAPDPGRPTP